MERKIYKLDIRGKPYPVTEDDIYVTPVYVSEYVVSRTQTRDGQCGNSVANRLKIVGRLWESLEIFLLSFIAYPVDKTPYRRGMYYYLMDPNGRKVRAAKDYLAERGLLQVIGRWDVLPDRKKTFEAIRDLFERVRIYASDILKYDSLSDTIAYYANSSAGRLGLTERGMWTDGPCAEKLNAALVSHTYAVLTKKVERSYFFWKKTKSVYEPVSFAGPDVTYLLRWLTILRWTFNEKLCAQNGKISMEFEEPRIRDLCAAIALALPAHYKSLKITSAVWLRMYYEHMLLLYAANVISTLDIKYGRHNFKDVDSFVFLGLGSCCDHKSVTAGKPQQNPAGDSNEFTVSLFWCPLASELE